MNTVKFPEAVSDVILPNGQVWDASGDEISIKDWNVAPRVVAPVPPARIDIAWYEEQRIRIRAVQNQATRVNETLCRHWYKVIKRSLADLPIQAGGRSLQNPEYGANLRNIAVALAIAPRTLAGYRTAVSRIPDEAHFNELASKGLSWSQIVFRFGAGPMRRLMDTGSPESPAPSGLPPVKRRFVVQVPTQLADFLMDNGLEAPDVTAVVVAYLRQPKVHRELLKLFRVAAAVPAPETAP